MKIRDIRENIMAGASDALLSRLYQRSEEKLSGYRARILEAAEGLMRTYGYDENTEAAVFSAPGRTELGGNHTDHQGGAVLTGSVDLDALAVVVPTGGHTVRLYSREFGETRIDTSKLMIRPEEQGTTAALLRGVLSGLSRRYDENSGAKREDRPLGFDAYVLSDVPGGSGLSSSACFEILCGTMVSSLFYDNAFSPMEIAKTGQYAENVYFGKPSGLLDQAGCGIGGIVSVDFREKEDPYIKPVPFDMTASGYALCMIETGGDHSKLTPYYAAIPEEMRAVAECFGEEVLSRVSEEKFYSGLARVRKKTGDRAALRAMHYFAETKRALQQAEALEDGDFHKYLELVRESGDSSFKYLQNVETYEDPQNQKIIFALSLAEHLLKGRGAVRVHGGGFAGAIQAYVPEEMLEEFKTGMDQVLGSGSCREIFIRPAGGCRLV